MNYPPCLSNVDDAEGQSTYCPECKTLLIERNWYQLGQGNLDARPSVVSAARHWPDILILSQGDGGRGESR